MANARDAREWARTALRGIGDSLYTPFCGRDGDDVDWDAYRTLVRYCAGDLGHDMLWCADYFTHWGAAFKYAASVLGLPIGEYPHSRPPQAVLPDAAKEQIQYAYQRLGLVDG
jgi:4-hydroxy-tetrahydrodipicolinate synthase